MMESRCLYICRSFYDFLRFVCTGDYLDEDESLNCGANVKFGAGDVAILFPGKGFSP